MHNIPDFLRVTPEMQEHFAKGGMIKRADGSYSRRGLWDNIRANKGSGKKPTKEMLEQERKIRAKEYEVGGPITFSAGGEKHKIYKKESPTGNGEGVKGHIMVTHPTMDKGKWDTIDLTEKSGAQTVSEGVAATKKWHEENPEYGKGGYTVRRSHDRKGKTHVVIGPDGTKKYFGDPNMGERGKSKHGKEAFYARHAKNLKNNPYFRAYARATWEDGGEVPHFDNGGSYGPFYNRRDAAKMQRWRTPSADSMTPSFFAMGGLNKYQDAGGVMLPNTINTGQGINTTSPAWSPSISPVAQTPNITTAGLDKQNQNQFTMDEKQITTKSPSDDTKMQPGTDVTNLLQSSFSNPAEGISKGLSQLSNSMSSGLAATNILSRTFGNSQQNAVLDFNKKQDNPANYLNKVSNFAGIQYAKDGGTIGNYKEGDEIELTPTQMYLLEKKGYKFQIIN